MANADLRRQDGPFKFDVYLGFSDDDKGVMHRLQEKLERHGMLCYPKYNAADSQQSTQTAICQGVARSWKCLLYVSVSFIEDKWYRYEVAEVLRKVERFSRDMLIILKDSQLAVLPPELSKYSVNVVYDARMLEDSHFLDGLAAAIKRGKWFSFITMAKLAHFCSFQDSNCVRLDFTLTGTCIISEIKLTKLTVNEINSKRN